MSNNCASPLHLHINTWDRNALRRSGRCASGKKHQKVDSFWRVLWDDLFCFTLLQTVINVHVVVIPIVKQVMNASVSMKLETA